MSILSSFCIQQHYLQDYILAPVSGIFDVYEIGICKGTR